MSKPVILIISYPTDAHAKYLIDRLGNRGCVVHLIDFGVYPEEVASAVLLLHGKAPQLSWSSESNLADEPVGIWWRRPRGAYRQVRSTMADRYIESEAESYTRSLSSVMRCARWVSDPEATRSASQKLRQLTAARACGLRIPDTFAGNCPAAAEEYLSGLKGRSLVMKAINQGYVRLNPKEEDREGLNRVIYTKRVTPDFVLKNIVNISACPILLQEEIKKQFDVRVTVVADRVFAVSIRSNVDTSEVDWRHHTRDRVYERHELPPSIAALCITLVANLGLVFGCIDLAYSENEGYTFFEINPQGQWLPSEHVWGGAISETLADLLTDTLPS